MATHDITVTAWHPYPVFRWEYKLNDGSSGDWQEISGSDDGGEAYAPFLRANPTIPATYTMTLGLAPSDTIGFSINYWSPGNHLGAISPSWWEASDSGDTVLQILVNTSGNGFVKSAAGAKWQGSNTFALTIDSQPPLELSWDLATSRYAFGADDLPLYNYLIGLGVGADVQVAMPGVEGVLPSVDTKTIIIDDPVDGEQASIRCLIGKPDTLDMSDENASDLAVSEEVYVSVGALAWNPDLLPADPSTIQGPGAGEVLLGGLFVTYQDQIITYGV